MYPAQPPTAAAFVLLVGLIAVVLVAVGGPPDPPLRPQPDPKMIGLQLR